MMRRLLKRTIVFAACMGLLPWNLADHLMKRWGLGAA